MSFQFNSDKEQIKANAPSIIGGEELTIRVGSGSDEKEILRAQLDTVTSLPRVGINRTGNRIDRIIVTSQGTGYTVQPTVTLGPPPQGGIQALGSAVIQDGYVLAIIIDNIGKGYLTAPSVTITGGNGVGASATAFLDTVDFELDINGAIRTSTSIISDTARILNLDIDNFVTPDTQFRAPNLKTYLNNGGTAWSSSVIVQENQYRYHNQNVYQILNAGTTGTTPPNHTDGIVLNGDVQFKHIGIKVNDVSQPYYNQGGQSGIFPRSITPNFGNRSDAIATTAYVLNLATNDVGGRVYVSEQIGSDLNDGRSAVAPVRTIKKAAQIAWSTPGIKETLIVSGGDYVEDNPISLPPDCSVVGDNLRLVLIRPNNPRKHIFKFGDKNYVTGVTYRDKIDSSGDPVATWDYAMVFDDKQRIEIDTTANGDFGVDFPIGHQIFGPEKFRATFQNNTGLSSLVSGIRVRGINTGALGTLSSIDFTTITGASAFVTGAVDFTVISGSFNAGETFQFAGAGVLIYTQNTVYTLGQTVWSGDRVYTVTTAGTSNSSAPSQASGTSTIGTVVFTFLRTAFEFISTDLQSIRAEGEVVFIDEDNTTPSPIVRIDFSKQGDPSIATGGFGDYGSPEDLGGIIFYTNALVGRQNTHNFKEGQEIIISNLPTSSPDLSFLNGKQRIYKVIEDADGRARRFVIPKKTSVTVDANFDPGQFAVVRSYSKSVTLSLLNSPNKFPVAVPVARRYQDACLQIRNNADFIADEVVRRINDEFKKEYYPVYNISGVQFKIFLGTSPVIHTYVSGGTVTFNGTNYNITGFVYDTAVTGQATITTNIPIPSLVNDSTVKLANILLQCTINGVITQKKYPSFSIPVSDEKCRRDVRHFLNAVCRDLEFGSNYNIIDAAKKYISAGQIASTIDYEIIQTVRAIEYTRELIIYAMRKWRTGIGSPTSPVYTPLYSTITRYFDPTIIDDITTGGLSYCANVASAINTLSFLFVDVLANNTSGTLLDAAWLIARNRDLIADEAYLRTQRQFPTLGLSDLNESKCRRDINFVISGLIRDISVGGHVGVVNAAEYYYTGGALTGIPEAQRPATLFAFAQAKNLVIETIRNWSSGTVATRTPTGATYNSTTGVVTVTFPTPSTPVTTAHRIAFKEGALTFSCSSNGGGNLASPTKTDRNYGKSLAITNVSTGGGSTTVTVNVGNGGTATGVAHTYVSSLANGTIIVYNPQPITPSNVVYDPSTGVAVVTSAGHGLTNGAKILVEPYAWKFTCALDGNATQHAYPRPYKSKTPTGVTYNPSTGIATFTVANHGLATGSAIKLLPNSIIFTCALDNNATQHSYPRVTDKNYDLDLRVTSTGTDTFTVNVGVSSDTSAHTFVSAVTGAITYGTPDPIYNTPVTVSAVTTDTFTINVGVSSDTSAHTFISSTTNSVLPVVTTKTPSEAAYNPTTGLVTFTVATHGLSAGDRIIVNPNSLSYTCALDNNASTHTYPRVPTVSFKTPSTVAYNHTTGIATFTVASHGIPTNGEIVIAPNSLTFTCASDGNVSQHTYPRPSDTTAYFKKLKVTNTGTNTFTVNVGVAPVASQYAHTFVSAAAGAVSYTSNDPAYKNTLVVSSVPTANTFTVNVGVSSDTSAHTFTGASAGAINYYPYNNTLSSPVPKYEDWNILLSAQSPLCADVASAITTSFTLLNDILAGTIAAGVTTRTYGTLYSTSSILSYPDSTIYDADGVVYTPRSDYDDYPIIEASPYTQNASVISFLGGGGALIDGSKVKQPNCPFPGLELNGSATFPNQGKSMVAAAFTIVSFGGTGYKIIKDGYVQLVSVFVLFAEDGILAESGGYASVTNSATNFGIYALRATGYNNFAYSFDVGIIENVSSTVVGKTQLTVTNLGREPLEHYVVKIDGYENINPDIEYFIETVTPLTNAFPFRATLVLESGTGGAAEFKDTTTGNPVSNSVLVSKTIRLHRPSIVNSSSHTWEFAGSGTDYNALPENGGVKDEAKEQFGEQYGRVYCSGTDELGDFKVGTFAKIENRTGNITFTGTVTISEVEFLKLKGGDVVVTGFDASNTLGGANTTNSKLPTQKAVRDYITNNLGPYINKPYSTNAVPRALVELTDSGKISLDQIPPLRPFNVFTIPDQASRLAIEGALAGDIAIQQDTSNSFILNNDNASLFVSFNIDATLQFTTNDIFTGSLSTGKIQATEYRQGVVYQINLTDAGSGYTSAPVITITGGAQQQGGVQAAATCTIANGQVVTIKIVIFNSLIGGKGYTTQPTVTFSAPPGTGVTATGVALIESRVYGNIVNNIKITDTDTIQSSDIPAETININRVINTSASSNNNWVSLSTNQIAASDITSGVISSTRLANNSDAANSFTFLRGDQSYAPAVQSIKGAESRYFAKLVSPGVSGSSQLIFATNSNTLIGHEVINNVIGIQANTNITGVVTAAGLTTISLNNSLTSTIVSGSIIELKRGSSPLLFESSFTISGFVDSLVIANGGQGFTSGQYFNVPLSGGSGVDLKANIIVTSGVVVEANVTDAGSGYTGDFTLSAAPTEIGGGSNLVINAKINTVSRQFANVSLDIQRVTDLTINADDFGTVGVSRFKKSQFLLGQSGNGSVVLKTGADSGLDADLLDGAQGSYYLNASNLNAGTVSTDRLSGTYNISISGQSGNTIRVITNTSNPTSNPSPNAFSTGIVVDTRNNFSNGLNDGGTKNLVMTLRPGGSGFTVDGGVKQLAFTDNDNMYLRGSGTSVDTFGSWGKVWTSLNDGPGTGLDADRLDNRQVTWVQNALNMNYGVLSDNRLPAFQTKKQFQSSVRVVEFTGQPRFKIYIPDEVLSTSPFLAGLSVNLYNSSDQATGALLITNLEINDDQTDVFNNYTIITGTLTTGNFDGAVAIGTASNKRVFKDFSISPLDANADGIADGTFVAATLESDGGTANLRLGRKDGVATLPGIYFNSSSAIASFNSAIVATGGTGATGSGTLDVKVVNADGLTLNNNIIWNAGNVTFNSTNVVSTAVIRDVSGNFAAGTITAALTGAASLNVLKAGDTMTGSLAITGASSNLSVGGTLGVTGNTTLTANLTVDTDTLFVDATNNRVGVKTITPGTTLEVVGALRGGSFAVSATNIGEAWFGRGSDRTLGSYTLQLGGASATSTKFEIVDRAWTKVMYSLSGEAAANTLVASDVSNIGIGKVPATGYKLDVEGKGRFTTSLEIDSANDNTGAPLLFLGSSGFSNFRIGNQLLVNDVFEITSSTANGGSTFKTTPSLAILGATNRVAVNTTNFSGTDTTVSPNVLRNYQLNVQGDININGAVFQNNAAFVTSRWTQATNQLDIYRVSKVGINKVDPSYTLHVSGNVNFEGASFTSQANTNVLYVNGDRQYIDTYGVFKTNRNTVAENITIPGGTNAMSAGPITINSGTTITIASGAAWSVI